MTEAAEDPTAEYSSVVNTVGSVVFKGLDADARTWVQNNYPRMHSEPGSGQPEPRPDVVLVNAEGDKQAWHGPEGGWVDFVGDLASTPGMHASVEPKRSASKADWRRFALSQTAAGDDETRNWIRDQKTTKEDLIEEYGKDEDA